MFCRQTSKNNIEIVVNDTDTKLLYSAVQIQDYSFVAQEDGQWTVYFLTEDGTLNKVTSTSVNQYKREMELSDQNEIFSDLLGEPDECDIDLQLQQATADVYCLSEKDSILSFKEKGRSLIVSFDHVFILIEEESRHSVHVFALSDSHSGAMAVNVVKKIECPKISPTTEDSKEPSYLVCKLITCNEGRGNNTSYSDVISVGTELFKVLFGENATLLDSPVLLLEQPDGTVCCHCVNRLGADKSCTGSEEWHMLCQMSSSVTSVVKLCLTTSGNSDTMNYDVLGICGQNRKTALLYCCHKDNIVCTSEVLLCGPVVSVVGLRNKLYHSTGSELVETCLKLQKADAKLSSGFDIVATTTRVLFTGYIKIIHTARSDCFTEGEDSPCTVYCTQLNSQLKKIEVPTGSVVDEAALGCRNLENLNDILRSIDDIQEQRECIQQKQACEIHFLQQLGILAHLIQSRLSQSVINEKRGCTHDLSSYFCVSQSLKNLDERSPDQITLEIQISHSLPLALSTFWTVTASTHCDNEEVESFSVMKHIKNDWKSGEKITLSLQEKLVRLMKGVAFQVNVTFRRESYDCHQQSSISSRLESNYKLRQESCNKLASCIGIPVFSKELDVIDCLTYLCDLTRNCSSGNMSISSRLQKLADRRMGVPEGSAKDPSVTDSTRGCVRFQVPSAGETKAKASQFLKTLFRQMYATEITHNSFLMKTTEGDISLTVNRKEGDRKHSVGEVSEIVVKSSAQIVASVNNALEKHGILLQQHS